MHTESGSMKKYTLTSNEKKWPSAQKFLTFVRMKGETEYSKFAASKDLTLWNKLLHFCEQEHVADLTELFSSHELLLNNGISTVKHLLLEWAVRKYSLTVTKCLVDCWCSDVLVDSDRMGKILLATLNTHYEAAAKLAYLLTVCGFNYARLNTELQQLTKTVIESREASKDLLIVLLDNCYAEDSGCLLNHAIVHNNVFAAMSLLERGVPIKDLFITSNLHLYRTHFASLLSCVIRQGRLDWLTQLLSAIVQFRADDMKLIINSKQDQHNTCLHIAVNCCGRQDLAKKKSNYDSEELPRRDIIGLLLENAADLLAVNVDNEVPLHVAVRVGSWEAVYDLLGQGQQEGQLAARDKSGLTPLLATAAYDATYCFHTMMYCGALDSQPHHFNATDNQQRTILHLAVARVFCRTESEYGAVEAIELFYHKLLAADPECLDRIDGDNNTALDVASERGDNSIINMLLKHSDPDDTTRSSALIKAAKRGKLATCKAIVCVTDGECGDKCDEHGNSSVHWAASRGHTHVVAYLALISPPSLNHYHQTPMHLAASRGHLSVVQFLTQNKSYPGACILADCLGMTPLHYAAIKGRVEIVAYLLKESCCDVTLRDIWGRTVLDMAIESGQIDVCCTVLKCCSKVQRRILINGDIGGSIIRSQVPLSIIQHELLQLLQIAEPTTKTLNEKPIKRMIQHMPQLAVLVFELNTREKQEHILYNVECIDGCEDEWHYNRDSHPLCVMIKHKREQLLFHPLVSALLYHKSKPALIFYALFIGMYVLLLSLVTAFIMYSERPRSVAVCSANSRLVVPPEYLLMETKIKLGLMISSMLLIGCGLVIEVLQMMTMTLRRYVRESSNWLDWFSYCSMLLVILPLTPCGALMRWQMWLSAPCLLASWINVTVLLRRVPSCSAYIIIVHRVMKTFLRFFIVLFVFIIALGLAFFVLLSSQDSVPARLDSVLKIVIMKKDRGEEDFRDVFHTYIEGGDVGDKIIAAAGYIIYAVFMGVMIIVILDLLVGLAVGDLHKLSTQAKLERIKLAVYLQLDFEQSLRWLASHMSCLRGLMPAHKHIVIPKHKPRGCMASVRFKLRSLLLYDFHQPKDLHMNDISSSMKNAAISEMQHLKHEQSVHFNRFERLLIDVIKPTMQQINADMIDKTRETRQLIDDLNSKLEHLRQSAT